MGSWTRRFRQWFVASSAGFVCTLLSGVSGALPVTITIDEVVIDDVDHDHDAAAQGYSYMVAEALIGGQVVPVDHTPHVGVCIGAPQPNRPPHNTLECANHIEPLPGAWSFTKDVDPALGTIQARIQIRDDDAGKPNAIDVTPGRRGPAERGLALIINLVDGTWRLRDDPSNAVSPTTAQSELIGPGGIGPSDPNLLVGRIRFNVSFCGGGAACSDGSKLVCSGSACTTASPNPACAGRAGAVSCASGTYSCEAPPLDVPEKQNGEDDDCDILIDECNANQIGETFECAGSVGSCPVSPGKRTCEVAEQPPGACVVPPNVCQPRCSGQTSVTNVAELRAAVQQAALTDCKDVIVLAPGIYDLYDQELSINDSLELQGQGTSFGCQGLDAAAFASSTMSPDLGSARCDGDDGEDPGATVITTTRRPATDKDFQRLLNIGASGMAPEVTLRHLTVRGGFSLLDTFGDEGVGILSRANRIELYNVVVERNVARAPGVGIDHEAPGSLDLMRPTFIMVNSTVRENRSTTQGLGALGLQGDGGGMRLKGGTAFILRSAIVDNAAIRGGGISAYGPLSIFNSTISGNVGGEQAGGIWFTSAIAEPHLLQLHYTTVTNNAAAWVRGGFATNAGAGIAVRFENTVQLLGSVVAGNITCNGEAFIRCEDDSECPEGSSCSNFRCESLNGPAPFPTNLDQTNLCAEGHLDCLAQPFPDDPAGTFESLGGNVASEGCGVQSSFVLAGSGSTATDKVLKLALGQGCDAPQRSAFQDAVDRFCFRGLLMGGSVGGQNSDPNQPTGHVPPATGSEPFYQGLADDPVVLVGALADNGGPTLTHAVSSSSVAAQASRTLADPGDTLDAYPSTVPACPSTDQRGFAPALGQRPVQCDAGAFQSAATAALLADDLADELSLMFSDSDADGIADRVDPDPAVVSFVFDDRGAGGWTSGQIVDAGDQLLRVFDVQPNPGSGVVVIGLSEGGTEPALVRACGGNMQLFVAAGEVEWIDCSQQLPACVLATDDLTVHDRAVVSVGGVFGGEVSLGQAHVNSDVLAAGDIVLQHATIAGEAIAGGYVVGASGSQIESGVSEGAFVRDRAVETRAITLGAEPVVVENDESLELQPGAYASLVLGDRGRLRLSPGSYSFAGMSLGNDSVLELSGFVDIATQNSLSVGDRVEMRTPAGGPAAADLIEWYTNASLVEIGHDVSWAGTLLAPHAAVTVHDRASLEGCLAGRSISLGHDSSIVSIWQLPVVVAAEESVADCSSNADCPEGICQAGACVPDGAGTCTETNAVDLGQPGTQTAVPTSGCVRVHDGYPSWWGTRQMKLEATAPGQYPVGFTWTNACTGGTGSGSFNGDWQAQLLPGISAGCATLIDLHGSGAGTVTLRYWAQ